MTKELTMKKFLDLEELMSPMLPEVVSRRRYSDAE